MRTKSVIVLFCFCVCFSLNQSGSAQEVRRSVVANGGTPTSDGTLTMQSAVGQAAIGRVTNSVVHGAGFWYTVTDFVTSVETVPDVMPGTFRLDQNYPNPFNPVTTIRFAVPKSTHVKLSLFDLLGRRVLTLIDEHLAAGEYKVNLRADQLSSGVYLYRLQSQGFIRTRKLTVLK